MKVYSPARSPKLGKFNAYSNHKILNKSEEAIKQYELKKEQMMLLLFEKYPFLERRFKKTNS
jgi:hypothetical protein